MEVYREVSMQEHSTILIFYAQPVYHSKAKLHAFIAALMNGVLLANSKAKKGTKP